MFLATGCYDGIVRIWDNQGNLLTLLKEHTGPVFSLKWTKTGNYILSGSYDRRSIVWDANSGRYDGRIYSTKLYLKRTPLSSSHSNLNPNQLHCHLDCPMGMHRCCCKSLFIACGTNLGFRLERFRYLRNVFIRHGHSRVLRIHRNDPSYQDISGTYRRGQRSHMEPGWYLSSIMF